MTPEQFCYWLQGFGELTKEPPTPEQWKSVKEHLDSVFVKVTPKAPGRLEDAIKKAEEARRKNRQLPGAVCSAPPYDPWKSPVPYIWDPFRITC